jgi:proline iminopeptidase
MGSGMSASPSFEGHVQVGAARLYCRVVGEGLPIVVLHGGPDFDHTYLLPELDGLSDAFRLVYYDQRGRGRSAEGVEPGDVSIGSDVADLDGLRCALGHESVAVLGHSWGGLLAMEYATRHPARVSHLILLSTAPASGEDALLMRQHFRRARPDGDVERMEEIASSPAYRAGDVEAEAAYYRIHFRIALHRPEQVDEVVGRLRAHFTADGILLARAIEERLYDDTWNTEGYDLLPRLRALEIPALVLHGEDDFVPVELVARIAEALPNAHPVVLPECGHFAYLESPGAFREHVTALFETS